MNTYRKLKKSTKALSPVVASIILIAVTVAVSVVVAAWMGGMTINLMGTAEQGVITNLQFTVTTGSPDEIVATVQNTGDVALTITGGFVNGNEATSIAAGTSMTVPKGDTETFTLTITEGTLIDATQYQVKLTTSKGNAIAYTSTYLAP
jgi:flagellin-like protein